MPVATVPAPPPEDPSIAPLVDTAAVSEYFDRLAQFGFSGSVLIGARDRPAFVGAYGWADRETRQPFLPSTVVTIGSITKTITAAAMMKLWEQHELSLDDSMAKYLKGVPDAKRGITIHHLLTHTSGLKRNGVDGGDFNLKATREAVLAEAMASDLLSAPGEQYAYSNLGYSLLAMIIEVVSGQSYEDFLSDQLFAPAGMFRTGYLRPQYYREELATGYREERRLDPVILQPKLPDGPTWNLRGNGGLHSDAYDMLRWVRALSGLGVLDRGTVRLMTQAHVDQGRGLPSYGYGWEVEGEEGHRDLSHSGGNGYFAADLHWLPDEGLTFFLATNDASNVNMTRLSAMVRAMLRGEDYVLPPRVVSVPDTALRSHEGVYGNAAGDSLIVRAEGTTLTIRAGGDEAIRALLGGEHGLLSPEVSVLATRSRTIVEREFAGDFRPKYDAMGGIVDEGTLARYHDYDRTVWDTKFGSLRLVRVVAGAAERDEVRVILRLEFERGAAAEVFTWRDGRLANISIIPDWSEFVFAQAVYPTSRVDFQSFNLGSSLRLIVRFEPDAADPARGRSLQVPRRSGQRWERRRP